MIHCRAFAAGHLALTVSATLLEIDEIIKTARTAGSAALAMIRSMDEIRSQIDQMVDHERFQLVDGRGAPTHSNNARPGSSLRPSSLSPS